MERKLLVVIGGPTGVGKTSLGIKLAKHFNSEILSADSRQLFKELHIGVAAPSKTELASVPHHFIKHCSITESYNAGRYEHESNKLLKNLFKTRDIVFMVGGTGLYIEAATKGLNKLPVENPNLRTELKETLNSQGIGALVTILMELDPNAKIKDPSNAQRIIRAIEILKSEGGNLDEHLEPRTSKYFNTLYLYINIDRAELYNKINMRVDKMIDQGLESEVRGLTEYQNLNALQTVGYKEFFDYIDGKQSFDKTVELIKQHSRNYAKRQFTWFKNKEYLAIQDFDDATNLINQKIIQLNHIQ